ncbi:hypothetical protein GJ744_002290 [Endocarpon pusillum]|uniref:Uncharacterized protein n=1 Tax=Endocarpon pusillum TaxID=364733 RepID=A0A8H7E8H2_9EURO|nr:hypothetical protein GJ744_002290 [Endocarpon pusillum]
MRRLDELSRLAQEAGATPATRLPGLRPPQPNLRFVSEADRTEARAILVQQRIQAKSYKDPTKQKRAVFRSKEKNEALADRSTWTFSLNERASALNEHIRKLGSIGVAQALAEFDQTRPLNVNILYPEKAEEKQKRSSSSLSSVLYNDLLQHVAQFDSVAYITFLASRGAPQVSKDQALAISLTHKLTNATKTLLQYDADPNIHTKQFLAAIEDGNLELVKLFLSAPKALNISSLTSGVPAAVDTNDYEILSLLLAYGADGNENGQALCVAIRAQHYLNTAAILAHSSNNITSESLDLAVIEACQIADDVCRARFLDLLLCAGATATTPVLQRELLQAIKCAQLGLVALLISHGTSPDCSDAEGIRWALKRSRFNVVELLLQGTISPSSASRVLNSIPRQIPEDILKKFVVILAENGASPESLGRILAISIENGFESVPKMLVDRGASLDYDNARSVGLLLKSCNLDLLEDVLKGSSSPAVLCKVLPGAMSIRCKRKRRQAVSLLLSKGVNGRELDIALQQAVGEAPEIRDRFLIDSLMEHKASVNFVDENGNCIHMATKHGDLALLQQLCSAGDLLVEVASSAVPLAFASMATNNFSVILQMVSLLLEKGAHGAPVAETLIEAVRHSHGLHIVALLLRKGADVNYLNGKAIEEALKLKDVAVLMLLCQEGQLTRQSLARLVPEGLNPQSYDPAKARSLVKCSVNYPEILSLALMNEVQAHGARQEMVELLLQCGASLDFNDGAVLRSAVCSGDLETTRLLLSTKPGKSALSPAFKVAAELPERSKRYEMMRVLLQLGVSGIGQDEALVEESRAPAGDDLSHVKLLIDHRASVNYQGGAALQEAIRARHVALLMLLLTKSPSVASLANAFSTARQASCSRDQRLTMFDLLLQAGSTGIQLNQALIESARREPSDLDIPRLLLRYDASVDFLNGEAMEIAVQSGSHPLLKLLVGSVHEKSSLEAAFLTARRTAFCSPRLRIDIFQCLLEAGLRGVQVNEALIEAAQRDATDLQLPLVLLSHQASVDFHSGRSLRIAVTAGNAALLKVLLARRPEKTSIELAFRRARQAQLSDQQRIDIYKCLLKEGVKQDAVNTALVEAVGTGSVDLVQLILLHGGNVNSADGNCFVVAATQEDAKIFKVLAANRPEMGVIIPLLIRSVNHETHLLQLLQLCFDSNSADVVSLSDSVIFTAMERFPRGARLIRFLLEHGCVANSTREFQLDEGAGIEEITALIWSLHQPRPGISDSVILSLLAVGARAKFVTSQSHVSAANIAAKNRRHAVLRELIRLGVDMSFRDGQKHSPLFYSSRNGDLEAVKLLIQAQARPDDGSLHEAARENHPEIVSYLLSHDHHVNFPSSQHSSGGCGRTALEELCANGTPKGDEWATRVHRTIELLLPIDSKSMAKSDGKSILHLALDNEHGLEVTEALLECAPVWKNINDAIHQYEDASGIVYSPTKYVEHFYEGSEVMRNKLIQLLKGKKCEDRMYRPIGEQIEDAVGLPEEIKAVVNRKINADRELGEEMKRRELFAAHQRDIQTREHQMSVQFSTERHNQSMKERRAEEAFACEIAQQKHILAIVHQRELHGERQNALGEESQLRLKNLQDESVQRKAITNSEQATELEHRRKLIVQDQSAAEARINRERMLMLDQEQAMQREHDRQIKLIGRQDESVRFKAREMRGLVRTQRSLNSGSETRRIEFGESAVD